MNGQIIDRERWQPIFHVGLLVAVSYMLWAQFVHVIWQSLFFGVVLTILWYPLYLRLERRISALWSASVVLLIALFLVVLPAYMAISYSMNASISFVDAVQKTGSSEQNFLLRAGQWLISVPYLGQLIGLTSDEDLMVQVTRLLGENAGSVREVGQAVLGIVYEGIAGFALVLGITLYSLWCLLRDGTSLARYVRALTPIDNHVIDIAFSEFVSMTRVIVKATFIIGAVQGTIGGFALWLVGAPSPAMWTIVMIGLSMLPMIGAVGVLGPTVGYYALYLYDYQSASIVFAFTLAVVVIDNVLRPILVGNDMKMHPALVLLGVVAGTIYYGAIGVLVGPIMLALFLAILDAFQEQSQDSALSFSSSRSLKKEDIVGTSSLETTK